MTGISILILTKNEQQDLPGCLESVAWSDDIHVFDSMSTDDTVAIAQKFGATVTQRDYGTNKLAFGGDEAAHRNWGLKHITFKHPWVFVIDADERMTDALVQSAQAAVKSAHNVVGFSIQRRDFYLGTWLKHVQASPYYLRLFKPDALHYERLINPIAVPHGETATISGYLDHFPFSKGMRYWLERHNAYSSAEAVQIIQNRERGGSFSIRKAFFESDFHQRRHHQKELFYRLPMRPFAKFLILYGLKRGFLDRGAGFSYAVLQSIYEYMIVLKVRELEQKQTLKGTL